MATKNAVPAKSDGGRRSVLGIVLLVAPIIGAVGYIAFGGNDDAPPPAIVRAVKPPEAPPPPVEPPEPSIQGIPIPRPSVSAPTGPCPPSFEPLEESYRDGSKGSGCGRRDDGGTVATGVWTIVDPVGRSLRGEYVNGEREGKWVATYPSGATFQIVWFHHGKKNGTWIQWKEDGTKVFEREYRDDRLDGWSIDYRADGGQTRVEYRDGIALH